MLALSFNLAIDGAINPKIISGTEKNIICPNTYLIVTIVDISPSEEYVPIIIPNITPKTSLKIRLLNNFFTIYPPFLFNTFM